MKHEITKTEYFMIAVGAGFCLTVGIVLGIFLANFIALFGPLIIG